MTRILFYACIFLLLSTVATSFGWYLACNKPCDPEYVEVKGDTVYLAPEPTNVIGLREFPDKPKRSFWGKEQTEHKVKKGETVYGIATRTYGIPVLSLMTFNNLTSERIKAGQVLKIGTKAQRDSMRTADSLYTYEKTFGDSTIKGTVLTQSYFPILSQSVKWESLAIKPKNRLFGGLGMDDRNRLYGMGAYEMKSGWLVTGAVGDGRYQFGVLKRIK